VNVLASLDSKGIPSSSAVVYLVEQTNVDNFQLKILSKAFKKKVSKANLDWSRVSRPPSLVIGLKNMNNGMI
jgi:hypothetical protein